MRGTYRVASTELLLGIQDGAAALCLVQRRLASDDCLALSAATAGPAADLRDGIPVVHGCDVCMYV
jgi:hypothetical protein